MCETDLHFHDGPKALNFAVGTTARRMASLRAGRWCCLALGGVLVVTIGAAAPASAQIFEGVAEVIDGDTLRMDGERLRLLDIDACETGQVAVFEGQTVDCGAWAAANVANRLAGKAIRCEETRRDRYRRPLVRCTVGGG